MLELIGIIDGNFHIRDNADNTEEVISNHEIFDVACAGIPLKGFSVDKTTGKVDIDSSVPVTTSETTYQYADGVSIEEDEYEDDPDWDEDESELDEDSDWDDYEDDSDDEEDDTDEDEDDADIYYGDEDDEQEMSDDDKSLDNAVIFDKLQEKYGVKKSTMKEFTRIYSRVAYFKSRSFKDRLKTVSSGPNYKKIQAMYNLAGDDEWEYDGCEVENTRCTFNHPISYAHYAINKTLYEQTGELRTIVFGCVCCDEFFDLDEEGKKLIRSINAILKRLGEDMWSIYESGQKDAYDKSLQPLKDLIAHLRGNGKNDWIWGELPLLEGIYDKFLKEDILLPKPLVYYVLNNLNKKSAKDYLELFISRPLDTYSEHNIFVKDYLDDYELAKNFGLSVQYAGLYGYDPVNERNNIKDNDKSVLNMSEMHEKGGFSLTAINNRLNLLEFLFDSRMFNKQDVELGRNYMNHIRLKDVVYNERIYQSKTYTLKGTKYICGGKGFSLAMEDMEKKLADTEYKYNLQNTWFDMFRYYAQTADMLMELIENVPQILKDSKCGNDKVSQLAEVVGISIQTARVMAGVTGQDIFLYLKKKSPIHAVEFPSVLTYRSNGKRLYKEMVRKEQRYYFKVNKSTRHEVNGGRGKYNHRKVWLDLYGMERYEIFQDDIGVEVGKDTVKPFIDNMPNILLQIKNRDKQFFESKVGNYTEEAGIKLFCEYLSNYNSASSYQIKLSIYDTGFGARQAFMLCKFIFDRLIKNMPSVDYTNYINSIYENLNCFDDELKYCIESKRVADENEGYEKNLNLIPYSCAKYAAYVDYCCANALYAKYTDEQSYYDKMQELLIQWTNEGNKMVFDYVERLKKADESVIEELNNLKNNFNLIKMSVNTTGSILDTKLDLILHVLTPEELEQNMSNLFSENELDRFVMGVKDSVRDLIREWVSKQNYGIAYTLEDILNLIKENKAGKDLKDRVQSKKESVIQIEQPKNMRYQLKDEPNVKKALELLDDWKENDDEKFQLFKQANGGFAYNSIIPKIKMYGNFTTNQLSYVQAAFNTMGELIDLTTVSQGEELTTAKTKQTVNNELTDEQKDDIIWFKEHMTDIPESVMSATDKAIISGIINYYETKGTVTGKQLYRIKQISKARQS